MTVGHTSVTFINISTCNTITIVTLITDTVETTWSIYTSGIMVTVVESNNTFVDVETYAIVILFVTGVAVTVEETDVIRTAGISWTFARLFTFIGVLANLSVTLKSIVTSAKE